MSTICVVVPVRNNLYLSEVFLSSFKRTTFFAPDTIKLLFINDGSTDGTSEWLKSVEADWISVLDHKESLGVCSSWNDGIRWSIEQGADYIAILNNDIEFYSNGVINSMKDVLDKNPGVYWTSPETCYDPKYKTGKKGRHHFEQLLYSGSKVSYIVGCCFMLPRRCVEEIGLFDEQFAIRYYEDLDYINRILANKKGLKMSAGSLILHKRGSTSLHVQGGETNVDLYERKWKGSSYDILAMQPKEKKGKKYFNFSKIW